MADPCGAEALALLLAQLRAAWDRGDHDKKSLDEIIRQARRRAEVRGGKRKTG